ncbi:MAG: single-stranded-DNA-specific exonuclease RecJ [Methylophilaceae bacterium]|nr:MAG: single-stranded-DNA-specific exonuclease RecJ [Methylophilaceae bacterium]
MAWARLINHVRKTIIKRQINDVAFARLVESGISPLLARLYAARGVKEDDTLSASLNHIIPPNQLTNSVVMAKLLAAAIADKKKILIIGDYDADGATATAVAVKGLLSMGAQVDFLVPNRFEYGYGLTPKIVQLAATMQPDVIVTVDNGIASVDGVLAANELGIQVLITDHHLPGDETPQAACIVNPNQQGCDFPSKHLAGVGVMFYVLLALRAELRERGMFMSTPAPNLTELLDLVALGTVADLVKLDANNRILVEQGLRRIRAGACCPGISALLKVAGRQQAQVTAQDLGFYVGPRLNAAGRLDDMRLGIQCLLAGEDEALVLAQSLHDLNAERRSIESSMQDDALASLDAISVGDQYTISLYEPSWHQGVVGILASRIKEQYHRPVIAFAAIDDGLLKGSGRSIPGLHLRDALDMVTKRHPGLVVTFGGHAMAAGLSIYQDQLFNFQHAFEAVVRELLMPADLQALIETDGGFDTSEITLENAQLLANQVWGQGFAPPLFSDVFSLINQRIVGGKHLKVLLEKQGKRFDAIFFGQTELLPAQLEVVYQLQVNTYNGVQSVQLQLLHIV